MFGERRTNTSREKSDDTEAKWAPKNTKKTSSTASSSDGTEEGDERVSKRVSSKSAFTHISHMTKSLFAETGTEDAKSMFPDADEMKRRVRQNAVKNTYNVHDLYHQKGILQKIARQPLFENITLAVICINALYMAIDVDWNTAPELNQADLVFQVCENAFCAFFTTELLIRFGSFARKSTCLGDSWFVFDSVLVTSMIIETWVTAYVLPLLGLSLGGNVVLLRLLRLLRLSRMSRMARLLGSVPELLILLKGVWAAASACMWTALLIIIAMFIWALALKQLSMDLPLGDKYFKSVPDGMYNLMITGCFMKGFGLVMDDMKEQSIICLLLYFVFCLFTGVAVMKMLTGMLCKVVNHIAATETEKMSVAFVKDTLLRVLVEMGECNDAEAVHEVDAENLFISRDVFIKMMHLPKALDAFRKIGIDVLGLMTASEFIFPIVETDHGLFSESLELPNRLESRHSIEYQSLPFADFMDSILELRGGNTATVKDAVELRKFFRAELRSQLLLSDDNFRQSLRADHYLTARQNSMHSMDSSHHMSSGSKSAPIASSTTSTSVQTEVVQDGGGTATVVCPKAVPHSALRGSIGSAGTSASCPSRKLSFEADGSLEEVVVRGKSADGSLGARGSSASSRSSGGTALRGEKQKLSLQSVPEAGADPAAKQAVDDMHSCSTTASTSVQTEDRLEMTSKRLTAESVYGDFCCLSQSEKTKFLSAQADCLTNFSM